MTPSTTGQIRRPAPQSVQHVPGNKETWDRPPSKFGLGACQCSWERPESYKVNDLCDYERLGAAVTVTGGGTAELAIAPTIGSSWFCPVAIAMIIRDSTDPNLRRMVRVTGVTVAGCPVLPFNTQAPVAGTVNWIDSDEWDPDARDHCACPTPRWPCFSVAALNCPLSITLFSPQPAGISVVAHATLFGRRVGNCLEGREPQTPNGSSVPTG